MEAYTELARDLADFFDRLNRPGLVVRMHDADQDRTRIDRSSDEIGSHATRPVGAQIRDFGTGALKEGEGLQHGRMLGTLGDDVIALFPEREKRSFYREVVRFASPACEYDLSRTCPEYGRDLRRARKRTPEAGVSRPVIARRVAKELSQKGPPDRRHPGIDRRAGIVVDVDVGYF